MTDPDQVESREDLATFIDFLRKDLVTNPSEWENTDLSRFLEAMAAFVRDMHGLGTRFGWAMKLQEVDWRMFARVLAAAKVYE